VIDEKDYLMTSTVHQRITDSQCFAFINDFNYDRKSLISSRSP